jgi:hypothetical protein
MSAPYGLKLKKAIANGNWSDTSTWSGGVKPVAGDVVATNGFDITVDEDVEVYHITNVPVQDYRTKATPSMSSHVTTDSISGLNGEVVEYGYSPSQFAQIYYIFDGSNASSIRLYNNQGIGYRFDSAVAINKWSWDSGTSTSSRWAKDFELQASNDNTSWTVIDSVVGLNSRTYSNFSLSNTTAYTYYRVVVTADNGYGSAYYGEISLWRIEQGYEMEAATEGGSLILQDGVTLECTDNKIGLSSRGLSDHFVKYSGSSSATIIANFMESNSSISLRKSTFFHDGTGTLNIQGECRDRWPYMGTQAATTLTYYVDRYGYRIKCDGTGTTNLVGNIWYEHGGNGSERYYCFEVKNGHTFNITGDYDWSGINASGQQNVRTNFIRVDDSELNMTGDIHMYSHERDTTYPWGINGSTFNMTGDIVAYFRGTSDYARDYDYVRVINGSDTTKTVNIIGKIETNTRGYAFYTNNSYNNPVVFSGPFVSGKYGEMPFYAISIRIHNSGLSNNSFVFRDNTNTYNTYPSPEPSAITFVTPDVNVDLPSISDVRSGTIYGSGNYTGTLAVPLPSQVALGIATDNTTGTGVLSASDVWSEQVSSITTAGSIGERLKNASTVESTGDQLESFL